MKPTKWNLTFSYEDEHGKETTISHNDLWVRDDDERACQMFCVISTFIHVLLAVESLGIMVPMPGEEVRQDIVDLIDEKWHFWDNPNKPLEKIT